MEIETYSISLSTKGNCDIVDITDKVGNLIVKIILVKGTFFYLPVVNSRDNNN